MLVIMKMGHTNNCTHIASLFTYIHTLTHAHTHICATYIIHIHRYSYESNYLKNTNTPMQTRIRSKDSELIIIMLGCITIIFEYFETFKKLQ